MTRAELRRQKREQSKVGITRVFTEAQLAEHDRQVVAAYKKNADRHMRKVWDEYDHRQRDEFDKHINELWHQRWEELNTGTPEEQIDTMLSYLLAISARVLIERFGWLPLNGHRFTRRNKIVRFCNAVIDELDRIAHDKTIGAHEYAAETYRLYGVRFMMEETDDETQTTFTKE